MYLHVHTKGADWMHASICHASRITHHASTCHASTCIFVKDLSSKDLSLKDLSLYLRNRALHLRKIDLSFHKRGVFDNKTAMFICDGPVYLPKRPIFSVCAPVLACPIPRCVWCMRVYTYIYTNLSLFFFCHIHVPHCSFCIHKYEICISYVLSLSIHIYLYLCTYINIYVNIHT